jgi:DNA mismatch repair protein MutH
MNFKSEFELLEFTKGLIGKKFKDLDTFKVLSNEKSNKGKGILGQLVEKGFFGYESNNRPEADFKELGIELKVSGFLRTKKGNIVAKERLVLSKIDFFKILKESFEFSKLIFKNKKILIVWYEYDKDLHYSEMEIKKVQLYDMSNDIDFIERDFNIIKNKVFKGEAHLISEGDTDLLGACTKAADSSVTTSQPNSSTKAKPRAYSLKQSYLTGVLNNSKTKVAENITIETFINNKIKKYIGMTQLEILESFGTKINKIPKNISKMVIDRIIGKEDELKKINPFNKINFLLKTSPVDKNNRLLERLSFHNIEQSEFSEDWEDSYWKNYFEEQTVFLFLFEGSSLIRNGERKLVGFNVINFTDQDIESFGKTYNLIKKAILHKDRSMLPIPKSFDHQYLVIAPKGIKGDKAYEEFFKSNRTKACLMIEKEAINIKIKGEKYANK